MITIVTALLAGDENVKETYQSLRLLPSGHLRWLVKYSSSVFDSNLIELSQDPSVKLVFSSDSSLYEGLNQAIPYIDSEFFMVLGAGDTIESQAFSRALNLLRLNTSADAAFFSVFHRGINARLSPSPRDLPKRMSCPHPGAVLRTNLVRKLRGFDLTYKIASDYDLICRYIKEYPRCIVCDEILVNFKGGGISSRSPEGPYEEYLIRYRVFGTSLRR